MNLLFQSGRICKILLTPDGKISSVGKNILAEYKDSQEKVWDKRKNIKDYFDIDQLSFFSESFQAALEGDEIIRKKLIKINGKEHWFQVSFFPLWNESVQLYNVLFISEDVTDVFLKEKQILVQKKEKEEREEYLKQSEDKWRSFVENSPNIIFTLDKKFNFTYINYTFSGLKLQDIIGSNYIDYLLPQDRPLISQYLIDCIQKGIVREFEIQSIVNRNILNWYSTRIAPIRNNHTNEIEAIVGVSSEITEKKLAENLLLASQERFRALADNVPVMIWISDSSGKYTFFNKPWLDFTGRIMEEELSADWANSVHPDDFNVRKNLYKKSFQNREAFEIEYRLKRKAGDYRWLLERSVPFITSNKEFSGFIGSCIDITSRKQIESEIKASLEEKEILLKEIHHRVKNNLQIISSLLNLQSNQLDDPKIIEVFQTNIGRVKSIALIHDMLNTSIRQSAINFKDYLRLICNYLSMIHETRPQKVQIHLQSDDIEISIDLAIYIGLIVNEIISNSLKYAFPGDRVGNITIKVSCTDKKFISLKISDDGIGISEDLDLESVKSLGLKLVKTLTAQLKGTIEIQRKPELVFSILLPLQEEKNRG